MTERRGSWQVGAVTAVVALVLAAHPAPVAAQVFNPETFALANGMEVVVVPNHRSPIVSHMVWYKVGAADEVAGKSGIAHFLEHLMFKGTKSVPPGEFSKIVGREGGRDNAFTGHDYTGYFQNVARDRLEIVMRLESDRMANLVLTDAEVNPEREVILEERRSRVDNQPGARLGEQLNAALYLNHPYGRPVIGWEHEMRGLTTADALDWYRKYYAPNNATLIVAGDITAAELKPLAEKYYGTIPTRPVPARLRPQEPPPDAIRRVRLEDPQVSRPSWSRAYLAPSYTSGETKHAYALQVLAEIVGGGATSRLNRAIVVEKNLATSAGAGYSGNSLDQTTFDLYATPREGVEMSTLERSIDEEIARVIIEGVSADEVDRAKTRMQASAVYARDSLQGGARTLGSALSTGQSVADVEAWPSRIASVTVEQVVEAARAVLRLERSVTGELLPKPRS